MKRKHIILLVDNDAGFRQTRREQLEISRYEVVEASTVEEARAIILSQPCDLAIVDIRLQDEGLDDWSGLYLARDLSSRVPILLMSGYSEEVYETIRTRGLPEFDKTAVAVDFHIKQDGLGAMLDLAADLLKHPVAGRTMQATSARQAVFLAYGHSATAKDDVANFLKENGLKVLESGQATQYGDSILENVKRYVREACFAVVLFTGDDVGYSIRDGPTCSRKRARQNVIFELGYALGRLGQRRVRVLREENVEIPSNYLGWLYIRMGPDLVWREALARELRFAGININLENVLREVRGG